MTNGLTLITIILIGCTVLVDAQQKPERQKPVSKTATATKKISVPAPDFSVLTAFMDALLDLKAAIETGVNRQDFQRKLQNATGESLKAEARLPSGSDGSDIVQTCLFRYQISLNKYKVAAIMWDSLLVKRKAATYAENSRFESAADFKNILEEVSKAEADLQTKWSDAEHALDEARACTKAKSNKLGGL